MSIKRVILTSLFCVAMLFAAGKKAEAAFPYDMEQKIRQQWKAFRSTHLR